MKKILSIALAGTMMLSLTACGGKEEVKSVAPPDTIVNSQESQTELPSIDVEDPLISTEDIADTNSEDVVVSEEDTTEEDMTEETTEDNDEEAITEEDLLKYFEELQKNTPSNESGEKTVALVENSSLNATSEFSGLYKIGSYSRMAFMGSVSSFTSSMKGVEVENEGEVDLANAGISDTLISVFDYTYFYFEFNEGAITKWDIVDRKTNESVLGLTDEEITNKYFPENNYEIVNAGELPETVNLSNYEVGKTYAFDVPSEGNFSMPTIINDTDYSMLIVSTKDWNGNWERTYKSKYYMPDNSSGSTFSDDGKYYVSITEGDPSDLFSSDECFLLAGHEIGEELDFDFEDYIGNNTDKTITVKISDWGVEQEFKLLPGEILESSWMNDATITNIE